MNQSTTKPDESDIEIKSLEDNLTDYSATSTYFPTRFLDTHFLGSVGIDNKAIQDKYKKDLLTKVNAKSPRSSRIESAKKVINKGGLDSFRGTAISHYNLDEGNLFYEKTESIERGIKFGPLRFTQYSIMDILQSFMKKTENMPDCFGMNTVKKLDYISSFLYENYQLSDMEKNKLKNAVTSIKDSYSYFLQLHLLSQRKFYFDNKPEGGVSLSLNEIGTSKKEAQQHMKNLRDSFASLSALVKNARPN